MRFNGFDLYCILAALLYRGGPVTHKILLLAGDGIGPEIIGATEALLRVLMNRFDLSCEIEHALMRGCAIDVHNNSYNV